MIRDAIDIMIGKDGCSDLGKSALARFTKKRFLSGFILGVRGAPPGTFGAAYRLTGRTGLSAAAFGTKTVGPSNAPISLPFLIGHEEKHHAGFNSEDVADAAGAACG